MNPVPLVVQKVKGAGTGIEYGQIGTVTAYVKTVPVVLREPQEGVHSDAGNRQGEPFEQPIKNRHELKNITQTP